MTVCSVTSNNLRIIGHFHILLQPIIYVSAYEICVYKLWLILVRMLD